MTDRKRGVDSERVRDRERGINTERVRDREWRRKERERRIKKDIKISKCDGQKKRNR